MEQLQNFRKKVEEKTRQAEKIVRSYLPEEKGFAEELARAMNYSMCAGGKRLRPLLMREAYQMMGGSGELVYPFMAAIEMIHTHSLIHDDLPAIDNDDLRRGRETTHVVFGEALGVLSGDALLNYAYETALRVFEGRLSDTERERAVQGLRILARKTGIRGMLGGQSVDVTNEKQQRRSISQEMLDYIYENKTSALIEASLMTGAVLAGADEKSCALLEQIGSRVGIAFQIRDDILDVTATAEELGKPVFSDEKNEKTTYVTLLGVEGATREVERLTGEARELLAQLCPEGEKKFLEELLCDLATRKK